MKRIIFCKAEKKEINPDYYSCPSDFDCENCSKLKSSLRIKKKALGDGKEKNRKKPYTPKFGKSPIDKGSQELKALLETEKNSEFAQCMVALADKGANIFKIANAIARVPFKWEKKTGTFDMRLDLSKVSLRDEMVVRNAFTFLTERLKPVFPDTLIGQSINSEIAKMKAAFQQYKKVLEHYLYLRLLELCFDDLKRGLPYKTDDGDSNADLNVITQLFPPEKIRAMRKKRLKPAKRSSRGLWDDCIVTTVDELKRIGYSNMRAFIETARLLHHRHPKIYKDTDPDLIRQRYTYHTRNLKRSVIFS